MTRVARPRRALPKRVYWVRRLVVLGLLPALLLGMVVTIAHLLQGPGSGGTAVAVGSDTRSARRDPARPPTAEPTTASPTTGTPSKPARRTHQGLAQPDGPCRPDDVLVTPRLPDPHAGGPVRIVLLLTTERSPACTFQVDPDSVFVTVTADDGPIWSSQDCPSAIPTEAVVPRRKRAARVALTWHGRESDPTCAPSTPWVVEGEYVASAVARGSVTPIDVGFVLLPAVRPTVTITPTPTESPTGSPTEKPQT